MNLKSLAEPFAPSDIEWRIGQSGKNAKGVWAKVLAYVTARAIMDRLDAVCGPENWKNEFRHDGAAVMCGLSIFTDKGEWVTKWDGAENTDIEAVKGGLSGAMKRAGVQWGIGRYLYDLEEGWAEIVENGQHYVPKNDKKDLPAFRWNPPKLPGWALPKVAGPESVGSSNATSDRNGSDAVKAPSTTKDPDKRLNIRPEVWEAFYKKAGGDHQLVYRVVARVFGIDVPPPLPVKMSLNQHTRITDEIEAELAQ